MIKQVKNILRGMKRAKTCKISTETRLGNITVVLNLGVITSGGNSAFFGG